MAADVTIMLNEADIQASLNKFLPLYDKKGSFEIKLSSVSVSITNEINFRIDVRVKYKPGGFGLASVSGHISGSLKLDYVPDSQVLYVKPWVYKVNMHRVNNIIDQYFTGLFQYGMLYLRIAKGGGIPVHIPPLKNYVPRTNKVLGLKVNKIELKSGDAIIHSDFYLVP